MRITAREKRILAYVTRIEGCRMTQAALSADYKRPSIFYKVSAAQERGQAERVDMVHRLVKRGMLWLVPSSEGGEHLAYTTAAGREASGVRFDRESGE